MNRKLAGLLVLVLMLGLVSLPALAQDAGDPFDPFTSSLSGVVLFDPKVYGREGGAALPNLPQTPNVSNANTTNDIEPQNETSLDINPLDESNIVGGVNDYRTAGNGDVNCGYASSTDGGLTWSAGIIRGITRGNGGPFNYDAAGDPAVYFDSEGTAHFVCLGFDRDLGRSALLHGSSTDGGMTWNTPVAIVQSNTSNDFHDKEMLTVDLSATSPYSNSLYVQWTRYTSGFAVRRSYISYSRDGGASWSAPILVSGSQTSTQGASPAVGPDGTVYASWCSPCLGGADGIWFSRSSDGGNTWSAAVQAATLTDLPSPLPGNSFRTNSFPTPSASGVLTDTVYLTYADYSAGNANIMFTGSTDSGATWSIPIRANSRQQNDQFFQWMEVGPTGTIWVCYYDQSWNAMNWLDMSCSRSTNGGLSFQRARRVTTQSSDPADDGFGGLFIGDYNGLAVGSSPFPRPYWTDTRTGNAEAFTLNP